MEGEEEGVIEPPSEAGRWGDAGPVPPPPPRTRSRSRSRDRGGRRGDDRSHPHWERERERGHRDDRDGGRYQRDSHRESERGPRGGGDHHRGSRGRGGGGGYDRSYDHQTRGGEGGGRGDDRHYARAREEGGSGWAREREGGDRHRGEGGERGDDRRGRPAQGVERTALAAPGGVINHSLPPAAVIGGGGEEGDEDVAEEESEEAAAARVAAASRLRREAILAKHAAAAAAAAAVVAAPSASAPAPAAPALPPPSAPAPSVAAAALVLDDLRGPSHALPILPAASPTLAPLPPHAAVPIDDMFASDDDVAAGSAAHATNAAAVEASAASLRDAGAPTSSAAGGASLDTDDAEGYLRTRVGEALCGRYLVMGERGRGVFSSVLFCKDLAARPVEDGGVTGGGEGADATIVAEAAGGSIATAAAPVTVGASGALVRVHAALATGSTSHVAVKVVRANEVMRRAGTKEADILRAIATADPTGKYHCVRLLHVFEHAGHMCMAFEPLAANLKEVQDKFGKGVGLRLDAVRVYAAQLLLALGLLAKLNIVHADLKPHNILANERYNVIKLADFGSAFKGDSLDAEPTPYLVSRFYRAPEIILGARHTPALDMWSAACVLYELYTGVPLFPGHDNNDMLWRAQRLRGRFPHKMLRKHLAHTTSLGVEAHFDEQLRFRRAVLDPVTKLPGVRLEDVTDPSDDVHSRLLGKRAEGDDRRALSALGDLLERMLTLDPARRCTVGEALGHAFFAVHRRGAGGGSSGGGGA